MWVYSTEHETRENYYFCESRTLTPLYTGFLYIGENKVIDVNIGKAGIPDDGFNVVVS